MAGPNACALGLMVALLMACGPSVTSGTDGSGATSDQGSSTSAGQANSMGGMVSTSMGAETSTSSAETADPGDTTGPAGTVPMYGACAIDADDCLPGLTCTPVGVLEDRSFASICTAECVEPAVDCEPAPAGWEPVCNGYFHDFGPDPFCAIGCRVDQACPDGMVCGVEVPFTEPFYCLPG